MSARPPSEGLGSWGWTPGSDLNSSPLPTEGPPLPQVWGISCEDRAMHFRQGVTPSELSGKTWKAIVASRECDRSYSGSSSSLLR